MVNNHPKSFFKTQLKENLFPPASAAHCPATSSCSSTTSCRSARPGSAPLARLYIVVKLNEWSLTKWKMITQLHENTCINMSYLGGSPAPAPCPSSILLATSTWCWSSSHLAAKKIISMLLKLKSKWLTLPLLLPCLCPWQYLCLLYPCPWSPCWPWWSHPDPCQSCLPCCQWCVFLKMRKTNVIQIW